MRSMALAARVRAWVLLTTACLLAGAPDAVARERVNCVTIRTDESVAAVARRMTGDARSMHATWFQIVNQTTSRPVPKARYGFVFAGWHACTTIEEAAVPDVAIEAAPQVVSSPAVLDMASPRPAAPTLAASVVWLPAAAIWSAVVMGFAVACWLADDHLAGRRDRRRVMKLYAERFVEEFARPLQQPHLAHRPIQSRLKLKPGRARFDVCLAPEAGLRYPNLTDHKGNVIYDVARIEQALGEPAFVSSRPYSRGRWVVVPFRFTL
jgi:hypothetical protein